MRSINYLIFYYFIKQIQSASEHLVDVYQSDDAVVRDAAIGALKELGMHN